MKYSEKLKDPRWQKKRLEILQRDEWSCKRCNSKENTLHVHHNSYSYGKDPWDYDESNFITLCEKCHETEEYYRYRIRETIADMLSRGLSSEKIFEPISALFVDTFI